MALKEQQPVVADILDEFAQENLNPEDQLALDEMRAQYQADREAALTNIGHSVLINTPDGTLVRQDELNAMRDDGQEVTNTYKNSRRA